MRTLARTGPSALVLVSIMFIGSLVLWVGVPLAWLWIGSQVQASSGSLGLAIAIAFVGVVLSIAGVVWVLSRLNEAYRRMRIARGLDDTGPLLLEMVMSTSAAIALIGFGAWFFLFSGSSPIPLGIGA